MGGAKARSVLRLSAFKALQRRDQGELVGLLAEK
jgi:hypothetical protein